MLIFLTAACVGGATSGMVLLVVFLAGLLTSNTAIAVASSFGFLRAGRNFAAYAVVSAVAGLLSLAVGGLLLLGRGGMLSRSSAADRHPRGLTRPEGPTGPAVPSGVPTNRRQLLP